MLLLQTASLLLVGGIFWALHELRIPSSFFLTMLVVFSSLGLGFLVLSRFALAVPAVVLDDCQVGQAMLRSGGLTQRKWLKLAVLLAKSSIGGYVAGMLPFWIASFIPANTPVPSWFPWVLTVTSIIGVTIVEPTMFIGFALLYLKDLTGNPIDSINSLRPSN